jgi:hypothetical protein
MGSARGISPDTRILPAWYPGDEGDGWVNWSGLATQLAKMETAFAGNVYRISHSSP